MSPHRVRGMSDEIGAIEDRNVAIHLARLEGRLEALIAGQNQTQRTIEQNSIDLRALADLGTKHEDHAKSITRLWEEIEKRDRIWDQRLGTLVEDHGKTRDRVNAIKYYA